MNCKSIDYTNKQNQEILIFLLVKLNTLIQIKSKIITLLISEPTDHDQSKTQDSYEQNSFVGF